MVGSATFTRPFDNWGVFCPAFAWLTGVFWIRFDAIADATWAVSEPTT